MSRFLYSLLSRDENGIDSIAFMSIVALLGLIGATAFVLVKDHTLFGPWTYATAALAIIGGNSGGKTLRDRLGQPPPAAAPTAGTQP